MQRQGYYGRTTMALPIATGQSFTLILDEEKQLWALGSNKYCQMPIARNVLGSNVFKKPHKINFSKKLPEFNSFFAGANCSFFIDSEGCVWYSGNISGVGDLLTLLTNRIIRKFETLSSITFVSNKFEHALFLAENGAVWACGNNSCSQLGLGDKRYRYSPEFIEDIPQMKFVFAGKNFSMFIDIEGNLWSCGENSAGQLGQGDTDDRIVPKRTKEIDHVAEVCANDPFGSILLTESGEVWTCGHNGYTTGEKLFLLGPKPKRVSELSAIQSLACGNEHSLFLDKDGKVWGCGKLGLGDSQTAHPLHIIEGIPKVHAICSSASHSLLLSDGGAIFAIGDNSLGQLGLGSTPHVNQPTEIPQIVVRLDIERPTKSAQTNS